MCLPIGNHSTCTSTMTSIQSSRRCVDLDADEENTFEIEIDCDTFFTFGRSALCTIEDMSFNVQIYLKKEKICPFSLSAILLCWRLNGMTK